MAWAEEQHFEAEWWGNCANTLGEQFKHPTYARLMGMEFVNDGGRYVIDRYGKSILDIGGGPTSMLLATWADRRTVVDPCPYPEWTRARYEAAGIEVVGSMGEDFVADQTYDEAWCYNVLQHTRDPREVIANMRRSARVIRMFEWVDEPPHEGHPHELKSAELAMWGRFDDGWWAQTPEVVWDHFVGGDYGKQPAFHGYTETGL